MDRKTLLKNAILWTGEGRHPGALVIHGDRIEALLYTEAGEGRSQVAALEAEPGVTVEDLGGLCLLAGGIDPHVHFRCPGHEYKEDWEHGSRAALFGGITTVLDMPNTNPPTISQEALDSKRELVRGHSQINYGFHVGGTNQNVTLIRDYRPQPPAVKIYLGATTGDLLFNQRPFLEKLFEHYGGPFIFHCESQPRIQERTRQFADEPPRPELHSIIRDNQTAVDSVELVLEMARQYPDEQFHVAHMSTIEEARLIAESGLNNISCEVAPHHLRFSTDDYASLENQIKMNPPVRSPENIKLLTEFLGSGRIDCLATDHAPHTFEEKQKPFPAAPSGVPGVDIGVPFLHDLIRREGFDKNLFPRMISENAARLFRLKDRGRLAPGWFADLIVFDPNETWTYKEEHIFSRCGWSPYQGDTYRGRIRATWVNGRKKFFLNDQNEVVFPFADSGEAATLGQEVTVG